MKSNNKVIQELGAHLYLPEYLQLTWFFQPELHRVIESFLTHAVCVAYSILGLYSLYPQLGKLICEILSFAR